MNILLISVQRNLDIISLKALHHLLLERGHGSFLLYLPVFDPADHIRLERLNSFVAQVAPEFIGISLMAIDYRFAKATTIHLKKTFPEIPVVWGGIHATTTPAMCLEDADYVCVGEGEQTLLDIAEAIEIRQPLVEIPNLSYLENGKVKQNAPFSVIEDLDTLPIIAQIPPNSFVETPQGIMPLESRHLAKYKRYRGRVYKIMTSRGCPNMCTYCVNNFLQKLSGYRRIRRRSVSHVMAELEQALKQGPEIEHVDITDDCFLASDMEYLSEFCCAFKTKIQKPFIAKGTPRYFTREKMDLLVDAGLVWANMGLQSGSDRVCQNVYKRNVSCQEFIQAAKLISEYPIAAYYDVIVDNPFESIDDSLRTVEVLMETPRPFYTLIFSLEFYHGTELYERALEECPERLDVASAKDYRFRENCPTNQLIEMAGVLPMPVMRYLLGRFRRNPGFLRTRFSVFCATIYSRTILIPLNYLKLIRRTQKGSLWQTLRVLRVYLIDGIIYYASFSKLGRNRNRGIGE